MPTDTTTTELERRLQSAIPPADTIGSPMFARIDAVFHEAAAELQRLREHLLVEKHDSKVNERNYHRELDRLEKLFIEIVAERDRLRDVNAKLVEACEAFQNYWLSGATWSEVNQKNQAALTYAKENPCT